MVDPQSLLVYIKVTVLSLESFEPILFSAMPALHSIVALPYFVKAADHRLCIIAASLPCRQWHLDYRASLSLYHRRSSMTSVTSFDPTGDPCTK
jgi:hypothetical protein